MFWPPVTGWLIALVRLVSQSDSVALLRLAWIVMDLGCVAAVAGLAGRLGRAIWPADDRRARSLSQWSAFAYAVYLPAISYAQFATSETPALLLTLSVLVLITGPGVSNLRFTAAGLLAGLQCLARPSLLPLLVLVPLAASRLRRPFDYAKALVFIAAGSVVVGAFVARNWIHAGEATISTNSAYNLFIGNRDMYAEDLDLFSPRATLAQIEFRRQQFGGTLPPFTQSPAESQRLALQWIRDHPLTFAKRALGRLARVFVPKTDVLELRGGETRAGVFAPASLALLAVTNVQWAMVLFGGLTGLVLIRHRNRDWSLLLAAVVAGAVLLCLIAISKPRYSFVFDPLLIVCALALWLDRPLVRLATAADRRGLAAAFAFLAWGWIAFLIFSITSRVAM